MPAFSKNLQRDTLRRYAGSKQASDIAKQLIPLKLEYSEYSKLLTGYVNKLVNINRVFPRHLPTQASFRWSTLDPPITNWPRACINPECQQRMRGTGYNSGVDVGFAEHEWTEVCWSVRDILLPDDDEVLVTWDHDNIEGRIHDLIVQDDAALEAHQQGFDLHTLTCCDIFGMVYPIDRRNPHGSVVDEQWRQQYNWQGKDTKQRVLAKNFNHGSKYTKTYKFVHKIAGIERYGVTRQHLEQLAKRYIESKGDAWKRKLDIMQRIQRDRVARTLYGGRRVFYDHSEETGREGFSHMISGTVSDYNNETLILLHKILGADVRLLHNAHDGDKIAIKKGSVPSKDELLNMIQRNVSYAGREVCLTAGVKVYE